MLTVDGQNFFLDLLDTAGQEQFSTLLDHWIRESEGFLLVYSIQSYVSFEYVKKLFDKISYTKESESINVILVGNKCDLPGEDRAVSYEDGKQYAEELKCPFFECSAKKGINIANIFEEIARLIHNNNNSSKSSDRINQLQHQQFMSMKKLNYCCVLL